MAKKSDNKYDNTRYVDMAIKVIKPAKPLKTQKGAKKNGKGK